MDDLSDNLILIRLTRMDVDMRRTAFRRDMGQYDSHLVESLCITTIVASLQEGAMVEVCNAL